MHTKSEFIIGHRPSRRQSPLSRSVMRKPLVFETYYPRIEEELRASLEPGQLPLYDMIRYHLGWVDAQAQPAQRSGGKLLRSTLCLSSCRASGGDPDRALPAAAAVELVHNFSLIHDDVQDISAYRRHQLAVWKVWGVAQAITAGDSLYALAHLELLRSAERGVPVGRVLDAAAALGRACRLLCEGQYLDILYETRREITANEYMEVVGAKTGALMGAASELGALVATEDDGVVNCLAAFGKHLGVAFQIHDDMLGIWEEVGTTGKSRYDDIMRRKKTLPVILGFARADDTARRELLALYAKPDLTLKDAEKVASILEGTGARAMSMEIVEQHKQRAVCELASARDAIGAREMMDILDFVLA